MNIGKWCRPQKRVDARIWEHKSPKVGSCWLAAQHYLLYSSLQLGSLLLLNSEGSHSERLLLFLTFTLRGSVNKAHEKLIVDIYVVLYIYCCTCFRYHWFASVI